MKNVFKFSYKFVSMPVNGLIMETPGNSFRLLCAGFRWNLYKLNRKNNAFECSFRSTIHSFVLVTKTTCVLFI